MTKCVLARLLALSVSVGIIFSGCSTSGSVSEVKNNAASEDSVSESNSGKLEDSVKDFEEIEFPDSLPEKIIMGDDLDYSYDNLEEHYEIEIISMNFGTEALPAKEDPVNQWLSKKFNMDITLTSPSGEDYQTILSTRFASQDYPDFFQLPSREYGFTLSDQGLLLDAKKVYPYMLLSNHYTTKNMIKWSTNAKNGEIPFITKYHLQDSNYGYAVREDWLKALGMEYPTTKEEVLEFAKAVTFNDPDGNGKNDTYFIAGGGEGKDWGMLEGFESMFGNPATHVENDALSHPYFNGTRKAVLSFFKELYDAKVLAPDWFTQNWEQAYGTAINNQTALVWFPAGAFYSQVVTNYMTDKSEENLTKWKYYLDAPIENGKFPANGNPGYCWAFMKEGFDGQEGKLKRVAHMIDSMTMGGENFFQTIGGSIPEVYEAAGIEVKGDRVYGYNDEGTAFYFATTKEGFPFGPFGSDPESEHYNATVAIWQMFGLATTYQINYVSDDMSAFDKKFNEETNKSNEVILNYERWPNDKLLISLTGEAAEADVSNADWVMAQEYAFVSGARSFDEWDDYLQEWLNKGGKSIIEQSAEQLGVPVPDYAK